MPTLSNLILAKLAADGLDRPLTAWKVSKYLLNCYIFNSY